MCIFQTIIKFKVLREGVQSTHTIATFCSSMREPIGSMDWTPKNRIVKKKIKAGKLREKPTLKGVKGNNH